MKIINLAMQMEGCPVIHGSVALTPIGMAIELKKPTDVAEQEALAHMGERAVQFLNDAVAGVQIVDLKPGYSVQVRGPGGILLDFYNPEESAPEQKFTPKQEEAAKDMATEILNRFSIHGQTPQ